MTKEDDVGGKEVEVEEVVLVVVWVLTPGPCLQRKQGSGSSHAKASASTPPCEVWYLG
jgi:hypothetical protein